MGEELKPCPFCGGSADVGEQFDPDGAYYFVNCTECMASTDVLLGQQSGYTEAEAIAAWNRRAPDAALIEAGDRLVGVMDDLVIHITMGWETDVLESPYLDAVKAWKEVRGEQSHD